MDPGTCLPARLDSRRAIGISLDERSVLPYCLDWTDAKGWPDLPSVTAWPGETEKYNYMPSHFLDFLEWSLPLPWIGFALDARYPGLPNDLDLPRERGSCDAARQRDGHRVRCLVLGLGFNLGFCLFLALSVDRFYIIIFFVRVVLCDLGGLRSGVFCFLFGFWFS